MVLCDMGNLPEDHVDRMARGWMPAEGQSTGDTRTDVV